MGVAIGNRDNIILKEFSDFTESILGLRSGTFEAYHRPRVFRAGVTNAADRGLDMYSNFGLAIQIKHISLTQDRMDEITGGVSADRIVIVCKDCEKETLLSVLTQFGQGGRIQAIVTESDLEQWYIRALSGPCSEKLGDQVLRCLEAEIVNEFPSTDSQDFESWWAERRYEVPDAEFWV